MSYTEVYLITGADKGLGLHLCMNSLEKGGLVVALAKDPSSSQELLDLCNQYSQRCLLLQCDVTDESSVNFAAREFEQKVRRQRIWGEQGIHGIDVMILNAGIGCLNENFRDLTVQHLRQNFDVDVVGAFLVLKSFLPFICKDHNPKVVAMTSDHASWEIVKTKSQPAISYSIAKAAQLMFMHQLTATQQFDESLRGIKFISLFPGFCDTDIGRQTGESLVTPHERAPYVIDGIKSCNENGAFVDFQCHALPL
jgi:NAD(P)-dependent dehydrogenase (short-subunit alcohol dehydrogenase family)